MTMPILSTKDLMLTQLKEKLQSLHTLLTETEATITIKPTPTDVLNQRLDVVAEVCIESKDTKHLGLVTLETNLDNCIDKIKNLLFGGKSYV